MGVDDKDEADVKETGEIELDGFAAIGQRLTRPLTPPSVSRSAHM
jgi:hypothetical protein